MKSWHWWVLGGIVVGVGAVALLRRSRSGAPSTTTAGGAPVRTTSATSYGDAVIAPDAQGKLPAGMVRDPYGTILSNRFGILAPRVSVPPQFQTPKIFS